MLLRNWQFSKVASPSSMVMTPVWRPWLPSKVQLVNLKKEPYPWMAPSGVPAPRVWGVKGYEFRV